MEKWIYLIVGGTAGTLARYILSGNISEKLGTTFPLGTLAVNLLGCFLVGFLDVLFEKKFFLSPNIRLLLTVGFCGAFTTFSTLIWETSNLIKGGQSWPAFFNVFLSVTLGFIVFRLGILLGKLI